MDFQVLKTAVAKQFVMMEKHELYQTAVEKDELWSTYLNSFPEGSNEIFRKRAYHDCSCCRQFIKTVGNCVAVINGQKVTIWDVEVDDPNYQAVCNNMSRLVKTAKITDKFLHYENKAGTQKSFEQLADKEIRTWNHFHVNINPKFVALKASIPTLLNESRTTCSVFARSLEEISLEAVDTVLELIAQNSLYRGEEHKATLVAFRQLKVKFDKLQWAEEKEIFPWDHLASGPVSKIRNTVIGTLVTDITQGVELEDAVKSFESKVAPLNYKRPTALISKKMIENAKAKLEELGLTSALERRFATKDDITANNTLFVDRDHKLPSGDVFDELASSVKSSPKSFSKIEEINIEKFLTDVLPKVKSMEVLMENSHQGNLVSLIAPTDPTAGKLFKWDNNFTWSYNGGVADSIKERVKTAGGNVSGYLCCRLAWYNHDDLDFHMKEPGSNEIYYGRKGPSTCGGQLDVDMNAGCGITRTPVENIFYASRNAMKEGIYTLNVHQFNRRESKDMGFDVEIEVEGQTYSFSRKESMRTGEIVTVAQLKYSKTKGIEVLESLLSTQRSKEVWGIQTNVFSKVSMITLSPNYWNDKPVGNKHYMFMLEGCTNNEPAKGFLNEFLKEELTPHRKVFETLASKIQVPESTNQLSGLGFSSTQRNSIVCRVKGSFTRQLRIMF